MQVLTHKEIEVLHCSTLTYTLPLKWCGFSKVQLLDFLIKKKNRLAEIKINEILKVLTGI